MTPRALLTLVCFVALSPAAHAEGNAEVISYGHSETAGVAATVSDQVFTPRNTNQSAAKFTPSSGVLRRPVGIALIEVGNRCTATNLGRPFAYNFANGVECASFSAPSPDKPRPRGKKPKLPSPEQIAAALFDRAIALAPDPDLRVAPARIGLTGLRSYFWLDTPPRPIVASASAGPTTVTAIAVPSQFTWNFGDGHDRATVSPGEPWRPQDPGPVRHLFQAEGRYELSVTVSWAARWRTGTGPWLPLGSFTTTDSRRYPVREVLAWLTRWR